MKTVSLLIASALLLVAPAAATAAEDAKFTTSYEGVDYKFTSAEEVEKFKKARAASLYQRLGGKPAIDAAVEAFYVKVLADPKVNHFFEDINMDAQKRKQKEFLSAAFGSPVAWTGKDMRKAHKNLDLTEEDFGAIAGHLQSTLEDLKLDEALVGEVMAIAASTHDDVLNK